MVAPLLKSHRLEKDFTQADVADRLGTSRANYSHMESGRRVNVLSAEQARLACEFLGIDALEMVLALGFKVTLPAGTQTAEEVHLLEAWREAPEITKAFIRAGLGL